MSDKYKTYEELKEELKSNYDLFMYEINLQLLMKIDKAIEYIKEHKDENNYVFLLPSELQVILSILGDKE